MPVGKNVTVRGNDSINDGISILEIYWNILFLQVIFNTAVMNYLNKKEAAHKVHTI